MKTMTLILSGLALIAATAACSTTQPAGEQINDAAITTSIESKYAADPLVSAVEVDVDTDDGVVRLSGTVESAAERAAAERIARDTNGVRRVVNDITLGDPSVGEKLTDAVIAAKIKAKLTADPDVNPFNIDVDVVEGVVTLSGEVKSAESRKEAEELARGTSGVKRVVNRIELDRS